MFDISLVLSVFFLSLASALSPGLFAIAIALLSGKQYQKTKTIAFLIGGAVTVLFLLFVGLNIDDISENFSEFFQPTGNGAIILGLLLIIFGIYSLIAKNDKIKTDVASKPDYLRITILGIILNITNFDAVLLNFTAIREIDNAKLAILPETILIIIAEFFFLSPVLVPLAIYIFYPEKSKKILDPIGNSMSKYGRFIVAAIFIIFGLLFLSRAGVLHL